MNKSYLNFMSCVILLAPISCFGGLFSSKEGRTFETRGGAVIYTSGAITAGVEQGDIQVPQYIDVTTSSQWSGLTHDRESGWTRCRLPLRGKMSWQGVKDRSLVFECRPLSYFN